MDRSATTVMPARRAYWLSLAALVVAVPAALATGTWKDAVAWYSQHDRRAVPGQMGTPVDYAGARWTVTRFTRLPGRDGSAAVLTEFEAMTADPKAFGSAVCEVTLSDGLGRTWQPTLFADPVIEHQHREVLDLGLCGGPTFASTEEGKPAKMVATFSIPASATGLHLSIAFSSGLPAYLSISEPGN